MAAEHKYESIPASMWPEFLTDERRKHFERIGEELVLRDVSSHRYSTAEKHFAAVEWLGERRRAKDRQEALLTKLVKWTLFIAALTLIATVATQ